jgi:hypothetical protein
MRNARLRASWRLLTRLPRNATSPSASASASVSGASRESSRDVRAFPLSLSAMRLVGLRTFHALFVGGRLGLGQMRQGIFAQANRIALLVSELSR